MSTRVFIEDFGDQSEAVRIRVNEEELIILDHDQYGWAGMEAVINLVLALSDYFNFPILESQDTV